MPIKERLEDIYGDREAERLLRTEYLDEANLSRIDERIGATGAGRDSLVQRGALGRAWRELSKAKSQVERLKQLNEEGILIRATIRILTRLFIESMEGKASAGQEAFSNRLVDISKAAVIPHEDRRILELYIGLAYGSPFQQRILPFACAKRQGLFKEHVEKVEREIKTEFETQRAIFARRVWQMYEKNIEEILNKNIMMYNKDRRIQGKPQCDEYEIEHDRECLKRTCGYAIKAYEGGGHLKRGEVMYGYYDIYYLLEAIAKDFGPLVRRQPNDIAIPMFSIAFGNVGYNIYSGAVRNDLVTCGYGDIVESIEGLVKLCGLLAKPVNHLQVKTKQRGQKAVQTRTIADMTHEMVQKLTELPKYTAMAKILRGKEVWKGRIRTCPLPEEPYHLRPPTLKDVVCGSSRLNIEETIRKRQENWRPKPETQPFIIPGMPVIEMPEWQLRSREMWQKIPAGKTEGAKDREKGDIAGEPPPPQRRPKKPRR